MTSLETNNAAAQIQAALEAELLKISAVQYDLAIATKGGSENMRREADVGFGVIVGEMWEVALRLCLQPHLEDDPVACVQALRWIHGGVSYHDLITGARVRMHEAEYELNKTRREPEEEWDDRSYLDDYCDCGDTDCNECNPG